MRLRSRVVIGLWWMGLVALSAATARPVGAESTSNMLVADVAQTLEEIQQQIARLQGPRQGVTAPDEHARVVEQIQELERGRAALLAIQASLHVPGAPSGPKRGVDRYQERTDAWRERTDRILERPDRLP